MAKQPEHDPYEDLIPELKLLPFMNFSGNKRLNRKIKAGIRARLVEEYEERQRRQARDDMMTPTAWAAARRST